MILASHGIIASQIASFDADAVAFFNRVTTAGGSLSLTEKQAVNQLVLDLKANSLWTPMKAIYPMVGASAAACAQNLKSSSFTGTFTATGWTFASTGAKPNGTSAYMSIPINPSVDFTSSMTVGVYLNSAYTVNGSYPEIYASNFGGNFNYWGGANFSDSLMGTASSQIQQSQTRTGFFNRRANLGIQVAWKNNALIGTNSQNYIATNNTFQLPENQSYAFHNSQYAIILMGNFISDTLSTNLYTAVQAFQTTLSRQV
jgi:hypothetical protein